MCIRDSLVRQAETLRVKMVNGSGDPIEKSSSYHAWRPIFNAIFQIEDLLSKTDSMDETRIAIEKKIVEKLNAIDPDLARYAPLVDVILPIQIPDNDLTSAMTGETRGGNIRELLTQVLSYEARQAPLL